MGGFMVVSPSHPWNIRDKINSIRLLILSADGRRRLQIAPKCKQLIRALRAIEFEVGRASHDKRSPFGHAIDALGYLSLSMTKGLTPWTIGESSWRVV